MVSSNKQLVATCGLALAHNENNLIRNKIFHGRLICQSHEKLYDMKMNEKCIFYNNKISSCGISDMVMKGRGQRE